METSRLNIPQTHISLSDNYIEDYLNLVYKKYPSFQNQIYITYYSLSLEESNFDKVMLTFYDSVNNEEYGGKFNKIYNLPVMSSTNSKYDMEATEKGIVTTNGSEISVKIDPNLNIDVKPNDILQFKINDNYYGFYRVNNIEKSATLRDPYKILSCTLAPGLNESKLDKFVITESIFIQEYHRVFEREAALLVMQVEEKLSFLLKVINDSYIPSIDFHELKDKESCVTSFERSLNRLYGQYKNHILMGNFNLSQSYNILFNQEEPLTIFDILVDPTISNKRDYYKRLRDMEYYNEMRENNTILDHIYYGIDCESYPNLQTHSYSSTSYTYKCSASLISDMDTGEFWDLFDLWLDILDGKKTIDDFVNKKSYDQVIFKLMRGWLKILVTEEFFDNRKDCTVRYFNEMCQDCSNNFHASILLSQLLYLDTYLMEAAPITPRFR